MSPAKPKLKVTPELCQGCRPGHYDCERACKPNAIRVGKGFVYVDWERCDGCLACVEMCETGALEARGGDVTNASVSSAAAGSTSGARVAAMPGSKSGGASPLGGGQKPTARKADPHTWMRLDRGGRRHRSSRLARGVVRTEQRHGPGDRDPHARKRAGPRAGRRSRRRIRRGAARDSAPGETSWSRPRESLRTSSRSPLDRQRGSVRERSWWGCWSPRGC